MDRSEIEIASLVAKAQTGDGDSIGKLFELLNNRVFRFFALRTKSRELAEDLTQTVFLEMIQALPRYRVRKNAKFTTWLFQIARFRLIDHYRKQRPTVPLEEAPEPGHEPLEGVDPLRSEAIAEALRKLPEKYQTILHLRFREDLATKDIAQIMHTTQLNVRVMQFRALRALRAILERSDSHTTVHEYV